MMTKSVIFINEAASSSPKHYSSNLWEKEKQKKYVTCFFLRQRIGWSDFSLEGEGGSLFCFVKNSNCTARYARQPLTPSPPLPKILNFRNDELPVSDLSSTLTRGFDRARLSLLARV